MINEKIFKFTFFNAKIINESTTQTLLKSECYLFMLIKSKNVQKSDRKMFYLTFGVEEITFGRRNLMLCFNTFEEYLVCCRLSIQNLSILFFNVITDTQIHH